jgi:phenylpyruvate tautomerase PptA (4-oxalocrotonate tautomerase family)
MPLWTIYHPVNAFSPEDKDAMAEKVTDIYARVMPRFYVNMVFQPIPEDSFYIGGKRRNNFVRITMEHIAREFPSEEMSRRFIDKVNQVLAPWVKDRGMDWEFHIDETPFTLWSVQGHYPPRAGTEDEKRWIAENRASPRTHD